MRDLNHFERSCEEKRFLTIRTMALKLKSNQRMFYRLAMEIMKCRKPCEFQFMRMAVDGCQYITMLDKCYLRSYIEEREEMWTK